VALDPNSADAHLFLAYTFAAVGRGEEALHNIAKGMRLNPHPSAAYQCALGLSYFVLEDYDQAMAAFKRGIEVTDAFTLNHYWLCLVYTFLGRDEEARSEREKVLASSGFREAVLQNIWLDEELNLRSRGLAERAGFVPAPRSSS
jgi:tetratricopeptide (TPR) repeat protein